MRARRQRDLGFGEGRGEVWFGLARSAGGDGFSQGDDHSAVDLFPVLARFLRLVPLYQG